MSHTQFDLTDDALTAALASRAVGPHTPNELVSAVAERIETLPQAREWQIPLVGRRRFMMAVAIGLLAIGAIGIAAIGNRLLENTNSGALLAYVSGNVAFEPCSTPCYENAAGFFRVDHRSIEIVQRGGSGKHVSVEIPGTLISGPVNDQDIARLSTAPVFSPDGTMLAYRLYDGETGIYVVNVDGTGLRMVAATRDVTLEPYHPWPMPGLAWSPDSKRIAYISPGVTVLARSTAPKNLVVADVRNGALATIVDANVDGGVGASFAWSPDGTKFAFTRDYPGDQIPQWGDAGWSGIVVAKADGSGEQRLTLTESGPNTFVVGLAWSPDGSRIALVRRLQPNSSTAFFEPQNVLSVVDAEGAHLNDLLPLSGSGCCINHSIDHLVAWSPDGSTIAAPGVDLVWSDGRGQKWGFPSTDWYAWSPDGSEMLVTTQQSLPNADGLELYMPQVVAMNMETGRRRWIANGDYPAWGPITP